MTEPFFSRLSDIDKEIEKGPKGCDFSRDIEPLLIEDASINYFYESLQDSGWLKVLINAGKFQDVPKPMKDPEKGTTMFPPWPASRYLSRMAEHEPETVLEIILKIPDTENFRAYLNFTDAALKMKPELSAALVPKIKMWLEFQYPSPLPKMVGELVSRLAHNGQVEEALDLTRTLLKISQDTDITNDTEGDEIYSSPPKLKALFDTWHYEQILKNVVPDLTKVAGEDVLILLCDLLETAVKLSLQSVDGQEVRATSLWRPAIEDHEQNHPYGLKDLLVSAVRDTAESIMETNGEAVLGIVEKYPQKIFKRVGLHLRRKWPNVDTEGTTKLLVSSLIFDDRDMNHEYFHLLREVFNSLPPETRAEYLNLVDKSLGLEKTDKILKNGRKQPGKEIEQYINLWTYTKLWPIKEFLEAEWSQKFEELKGKFGELEHPDFHSYFTTGGIGLSSPMEPKDLQSMEVEEIVSVLKDWQPPSDESFGPTREGLGHTLTSVVASNPDRFASESEKFKELDSVYIRTFLFGLEKALKEKESFSWGPVLRLCKWVIKQPRKSGQTRKQIAHLIYEGLSAEESIHFSKREEIWSIIRPLTEDPDPTPEDENSIEMHPSSLSINSTRGEAMHAVVQYALWVRRGIKEELNEEEQVDSSFDKMPEVKEVLNEHLTPEKEPSSAIHSTYGRFLPWLVSLDSDWVTENLSKIFPQEETLKHLYNAAWETYIIFCPPYDNVFELVSAEYGIAIRQMGGTTTLKKDILADPDKRVVEHLMTFYWRGKLKLDDTSGLLTLFYSKAYESLCGHALEFVGHSLHNSKDEEVPHQIIERLRALWQHHIGLMHSGKSQMGLTSFGWWFASAKFDDDWALKQLREVLQLTGKVEPDHLVAKRLAELASSVPALSIECLELMVKGDKEGWRIDLWKEEAKTILSTVLRSSEDSSKKTAENLVHLLGTQGHLGLRGLLL